MVATAPTSMSAEPKELDDALPPGFEQRTGKPGGYSTRPLTFLQLKGAKDADVGDGYDAKDLKFAEEKK